MISIIIVNYNVRDYLSNCISSIYSSIHNYKIEIIVIDNNSHDNSVQMIRDKYPKIKLIENKTNFGFSRAVNQGINFSTGEYILLLNPDTVLEKKTLSILYEYMEKHPNVGMCGPKILNSDGSLQLSCKRSFPSPVVALPKLLGLDKFFPRNKWIGKYNLTYLDEDQCHSVDAISGSFMFIKKYVIEKVGYLDENFFMFGEDLDLCFRVKKNNFEIHYVPFTEIIHFKGESVKSDPLESIKWFYNAMDLFVNKHFSSRTLFLFIFLLKTGIFLRKIFTLLLSTFIRSLPFFLDLISITISFFIGISLRFNSVEIIMYDYITILIIYSFIWIFICSILQLYSRFILYYNRALLASFLGFLVSVTFTYFLKEFAYSRAVLIYSSILICILIPGWRLFFNILRSRGYINFFKEGQSPIFSRRAIIVGLGSEGLRIFKKINQRPDTGIHVLGFVELSTDKLNSFEINSKTNINILGPMNKLSELIKFHNIRELIFTSDKLEIKEMIKTMDSLKDLHLMFRIVPRDKDTLLGKASVEDVSNIPFLNIEYTLYHRFNIFSKRLFDLFLSTILILLLSPFFLILKIIFKWEKKIIWGLENKKVEIREVKTNILFFKELPLLFNIFFGQISFVGSSRISVHNSRNNMICKPGLTGIYRIKKFNFEKNEENFYDHYYVQNQSMAFDLEILIRTILVI